MKMINKEILKERKRIKAIIEKEFESEMTMRRMKRVSRLKHIQEQIFWKIDNPHYKKAEQTPTMITKNCVKCCKDFKTTRKHVLICDKCKSGKNKDKGFIITTPARTLEQIEKDKIELGEMRSGVVDADVLEEIEREEQEERELAGIEP